MCATPEQQGSNATTEQLESSTKAKQQGQQVADSDQQGQIVTLCDECIVSSDNWRI